MRKILILSILLLLYIIPMNAQVVETLVTHPKIKDGMYVDDVGNVYTASGGLQNGFEIGKYDIASGNFVYNFLTGFNGPIDIDERANGDYVVTNFDNNSVVTVDISTNEITEIASGLDGPAGIAIDNEDNIYISNFGAPDLFEGHEIHKISASGEVSVLADSPLLYRFQAMVFNGNEELIVSSLNSLYKVNTTTGEIQLWVDLEYFGFGHMIYRTTDDCVYGTATGENKIFKVDAQGEVSVFAGSGPGFQDGDLETSLFNNPLGLEISPDENIIYVGDSNSLRRIILDESVGINTSQLITFNLYPNPTTNGLIYVDYDQYEGVYMNLYNVSGKLLFSRWFQRKQQILDLGMYDNGVYFLVLNDGIRTIRKKIIKKY